MAQPRRTGRSRNPERSREAILRAARRHFAREGYQKTTVRAVAAEAEIDPTMVIRYFGSKDDLFAAAVAVDLQLPDFATLPREQLGRGMVNHFLRRWEGDLADDTLGVLLRSAPTHPCAAERMRTIFTEQVRVAITAVVPDRAAERAALVASQLLGMALCRYVLKLPGLADAEPDVLVDNLTETLQRYLLGPLAGPQPVTADTTHTPLSAGHEKRH
jgi:AcrR family transcriptional regulator